MVSNNITFVSSPFSLRSTFVQRSTVQNKNLEQFQKSNVSTPRISRATIVSKTTVDMNANTDEPVASLNVFESIDKFWEFADESKINTQYDSDQKISFLKDASFEEIKKVCIQYRYFVSRYPSFLSWLVAKLPDGELRSLMAEILAEELGSGRKECAHIVWYDNFLRSLGISDEEMATSIYKENQSILDEIEHRCHQNGPEYVVGMVGMGGECLCQIYLTNMFKYLKDNKAVQKMDKKIDWTFWTYHIGEEDIKHRELVRKAISNAAVDGAGVRDLYLGYSWGKSTWDAFWANNYKETRVSI